MRTRSLAVETERYPRSLSRNSLAAVSLAAAAFLFGATFVVVKDAVTVLPPLGFVGWRFLIGALVLLAVARPRTRAALTAGVIAGLWLFAGYAFQTKGLVTTSVQLGLGHRPVRRPHSAPRRRGPTPPSPPPRARRCPLGIWWTRGAHDVKRLSAADGRCLDTRRRSRVCWSHRLPLPRRAPSPGCRDDRGATRGHRCPPGSRHPRSSRTS